MQYLLYSVGILILLVFIGYFIAFLQVYKSVFQYPKYEVIESKQVPDYLKNLYKVARKEIEVFGFKPCCYLWVEPIIKLYPPAVIDLLLYNQQFNTCAKVSIRYPAEAINLFDIEFYSFLKDRSLLLTMNGKADGLIAETPGFIIQDAYTGKASVQWQFHQETLGKLAATKKGCSFVPESFIQALQVHNEKHLDFLFKAGKLQQDKETKLFKIDLKTAWQVSRNLIRGGNKTSQILKQRQEIFKANPELLIDIPVELEVEGFKRIESQHQGLLGNKFRAWMLLGSFGLFVMSYIGMFKPLTLVILIAAVMLHEGGHLLAMKLCGYRNTSMLFLPFFGAVATARDKDDSTLTQKFWVSLAGPLPGLVLGLLIAIAFRGSGYPGWVHESAWILIGLNLFNLLPIFPLDGGKIVNLLLFSRFPYADFLFKLICLLLVGLLAMISPGFILLIISIALSIPQSFRTNKANSKLQRSLQQHSPQNRDSLINSIYMHLKQFNYKNLSSYSKYSLVKDLIQRYNQSQGKLSTLISLIVLYCVSLLGGVAGSLYAISPSLNLLSNLSYIFETPQQQNERFTQQQKYELEKTTALIVKNPHDINAYIKRARIRQRLRDYQNAIADYNQVIRLQPNQTKYRLNCASMHSRLCNFQAEVEDYDYILKQNPKNSIIYKKRALIRVRSHDYPGAINDYSSVIKLKPNDYWNYINRGYVHIQIKDYQSALKDANQAIKLAPQQSDSYKLRSEARYHSGDNLGASVDKRKAIALEQVWEEARED